MKREVLLTLITGAIFVGLFLIAQVFFHQKNTHDEVLTIGFLYDGDESIPSTNNFIRAQHAVEEKFGDRVRTVVRANVSSDQIDTALEELVGEGCNIIFTSSYSHALIAKEYAQKYPHVHFCQATGDNAHEAPVLKNYHTFMGEIYQGRYVAGLVAGMKLKELIQKEIITEAEAKIGYVAAYPYAEVISGYTAFLLGVRAIVPSATMTVAYTYT
ncbi:MAG: BMP family ABC transporter substrate-binding protein, partial [Treponema sp.]|nr:BMP family ABC transporter substrate-binding protein [Treponema sp.]